WSPPEVVHQVLSFKKELAFKSILHDTHHRAYTNSGAILTMGLHLFDAVLAFGEAIKRIYTDGFGLEKVWTFHEAADLENFFPRSAERETDVVWIGNWGDEERSKELHDYLVEPARSLPHLSFVAYGVRYTPDALGTLADAKVDFRGYLPNLRTPQAYAN